MNNLYVNTADYFQKIIHMSKPKLRVKYGKSVDQKKGTREYTTIVNYNKQTKVARFEVAITHPKLDKFTRAGGREEVIKKLANEKPFLTVDLSELVKDMDSKVEKKLVNHLLSDFTHVTIPLKLFGKIFL